MSKHTPGPWRMGQEGNFRIYGPDNTPSAGLLAEAFNRPNACLIAAAPELLEELKSYHDELCEGEGCSACILLAKAEGAQ